MSNLINSRNSRPCVKNTDFKKWDGLVEKEKIIKAAHRAGFVDVASYSCIDRRPTKVLDKTQQFVIPGYFCLVWKSD